MGRYVLRVPRYPRPAEDQGEEMFLVNEIRKRLENYAGGF